VRRLPRLAGAAQRGHPLPEAGAARPLVDAAHRSCSSLMVSSARTARSALVLGLRPSAIATAIRRRSPLAPSTPPTTSAPAISPAASSAPITHPLYFALYGPVRAVRLLVGQTPRPCLRAPPAPSGAVPAPCSPVPRPTPAPSRA